jgi:hypothetical protein
MTGEVILDQLERLAGRLEELTVSAEDPELPHVPPELLIRVGKEIATMDVALDALTTALEHALTDVVSRRQKSQKKRPQRSAPGSRGAIVPRPQHRSNATR